MMKISKFFLKNFSFFKTYKNNKPKFIFFLKSKNSGNPFRQSLYKTSHVMFYPQIGVFDNIKLYKNFDLFNYYYYIYFTRNQLRGLH